MEDNIIYFGRRDIMPVDSIMMPPMQTKPIKNKFGTTPLDKLPLTMAYVPMQPYGTVYEPEQALMNGTLFTLIDKPFLGAGKRR